MKLLLKLSSLFAFSFCSFSQMFAANLRESVCYIRKEQKALDSVQVSRVAGLLSDIGYVSAAGKLKSMADESYSGSGFVVKNSKGKCLILTNKHVVGSTNSFCIVFEGSDGKKREYHNCAIVDTAVHNDIAVIEMPKDFDCKDALPFYSSKIKDGDDIYSVGFPALGDKPTWQFAKGIVSNSRINMRDLEYKDSVFAIQHTAPIDPGSSGGPLLNKSDKGLYSVVGMNTWTVLRRQNAYLSLQLSDIKDFVDNVTPRKCDSKAMAESLKRDAEVFFEAFKEYSYEKLQKSLSDSVALSISKSFFEKFSIYSSSYETGHLKEGNPMNALRSMCIRAIYWSLRDLKAYSVSDTYIDANGIGHVILANNNGKIMDVDWKNENGTWKMIWTNGINFGTLRGFPKKSSSSVKDYHEGETVFIDKDSELKNNIELGYGFGLTDNAVLRARFQYSHDVLSFGFWGVALQYGRDKYSLVDSNDEWSYRQSSDEEDKKQYISDYVQPSMGLDFPIGFQCPVAVKRFRIIPYVRASVGFNVYTSLEINPHFLRSLAGGLKFGYKINSDRMLYVSGEYKYRKTSTDKSSTGFELYVPENYNDDDLCRFKTFMISIGLNL